VSAESSEERPAPGGAERPGAGPGGEAESAGEPGESRTPYSSPADVVAALQEEPPTRRRGRRETSGREVANGAASEDVASTDPEGARESATEPMSGQRTRRTRKQSGAPMTGPELCEATGLTPEQLADLEQYGLIEAAVLGGDSQYDDVALEVARIAARYAELGVGARHLRMYKVAAEREAGVVEQLVVPLLKQRNPEARERALERSEELQRMGAELHANLLRRRLGSDLGT
jgi:DNA-binding transcriptional MerR regulator